jgi:hypothetical protein
MVPLDDEVDATVLDGLVQSTDRAITRLLTEGDDPLALASYLWVVRTRGIVPINGARLVAWGVAWCRTIFADGRIGRRRDEDVASAALAAMALNGTDALVELHDSIRTGLERVVGRELDRRTIPFGWPAYSAIVLLAAHAFGVDDERFPAAAHETAAAYQRSIMGGHALGVTFVIALLEQFGAAEQRVTLLEWVRQAVDAPRTGYEDHAYLLQALWTAQGSGHDLLRVLSVRTLMASPALAYVGTGTEDVPPAGDGSVVVTVSHLYRAALLDVLARAREGAAGRAEAQLDARYRGHWVITTAAFFGMGTLILLVGTVLLWPLVSLAGAAHEYFVEANYRAMPPWQGWLYIGDSLLIFLLVLCVVGAVPPVWSLLIRSHVESDRRLREVVIPRLRTAIVLWLTLVLTGFLISAWAGVLAPGVRHLLGGT